MTWVTSGSRSFRRLRRSQSVRRARRCIRQADPASSPWPSALFCIISNGKNVFSQYEN